MRSQLKKLTGVLATAQKSNTKLNCAKISQKMGSAAMEKNAGLPMVLTN
jgi:hypothetical protein